MADFLHSLWTRIKLLCGSSRTIAVGYFLMLVSAADELKLIDWSTLFGVENGGRITAVLGLVTIAMRLVTHGPVQFTQPPTPPDPNENV